MNGGCNTVIGRDYNTLLIFNKSSDLRVTPGLQRLSKNCGISGIGFSFMGKCSIITGVPGFANTRPCKGQEVPSERYFKWI